MKTGVVKTLIVVAAFALVAGCHKQTAAVHPPPPPAPEKTVASVPAQPIHPRSTTQTVQNQSPTMPDAATKARIQDLLNRIQDVYFDYDKHNLRPDATTALEADAKTLKDILSQYPSYKLTVEGYCDERGSDEYNLALGDARAKRAQEFLVTLGLPASQLRTVSYGKEKSVCSEHDESCWQKNRRAHITQHQSS